MPQITKRRDDDGLQGDALSRLVTELGRAAHEGWGTTARLVILLLVASGGLAALLIVSR